MTDFGKYTAECLPKYIQKVQLTAGDELELLIVPEGILPVLQFLKDHHSAQFSNITDITALDVPSREYRFEVQFNHDVHLPCFKLNLIKYYRLSIIYCLCVSIQGFELKLTQMN